MEKFAAMNVLLEFELGCTGGEEDGVDNTDIDSSRLYTQPEDVAYSHEQLSQVPNAMFTCAASFGNVHGVYAPGNVDLQPVILHNSQKFLKEKLGCEDDKPMKFVFHGGSGSSVTVRRGASGAAYQGGGSMMTYKTNTETTIMRVAGSATSAMRKPQRSKRVRNDEA
jgi:fructose-bisphosphate aldolase class II